MGLLMRRRRPLMRVAAGAAVGTVAYQAGKRGADPGGQRTPPGEPFGASAGTSAHATSGHGPTADLDRLTELHAAGALTDAEFTAAKAQLLGI